MSEDVTTTTAVPEATPVTPPPATPAPEVPEPPRYRLRPKQVGTQVKTNAEAFAGIAAYEVFSLEVWLGDEWVLTTGAQVWRLNETNTIPGNRYVRNSVEDPRTVAVVDHDVRVADFPLPPKLAEVMGKLNALN